MATDNRIKAGKMYRATADRAVYLGDRTNLFDSSSEIEIVLSDDPVVMLEVHQIRDRHRGANVYDLYVLTKNGNLGWTRGMLWDDWEPLSSE